MRFISALSITLLVAAQAAAADGDYLSSIRLSLVALPDKGEVESTTTNTLTNVSVSSTESDTWTESAGRLSVGAFHNTGGTVAFNIGVGLNLSSFSATEDTYEQKLSEVGIFVEPGVSLNLYPQFSLELGVPLGVGSANYKETDTGYSFEASGGTYVEYGIVARPVGKFGRFQVYGEMGWLSNHASFSKSSVEGLPNVELEFNFTTKGAYYALGAGIGF